MQYCMKFNALSQKETLKMKIKSYLQDLNNSQFLEPAAPYCLSTFDTLSFILRNWMIQVLGSTKHNECENDVF